MRIRPQGFFALVVFSFLLTGCQRDPKIKNSGLHLLHAEDPEAKVTVESVLYPVASLTVEGYEKERTAVLKVAVLGRGDSPENTTCEFAEQLEKVPEKAWVPVALPMLLTSAKEDRELHPTLKTSLSFPGKTSRRDEITFLSDFSFHGFQFGSMWKLIPRKITGKDGVSCIAEAKICFPYKLEKKDGTYSCDATWSWLKTLIAVPDLLKSAWNRKEMIGNIKASFWELQDGEWVAKDPVVLK